MSWAWRIGRVRGIQIKLHVTFVFALMWGAYVLGWAAPAGRLYGAFLTILLFAFVLLHELGHALVAQRYGIKVEDIILLPIGGVARLHGMPERPRQELAVALAGPAVNLGLALVLLVILAPSWLAGGELVGRGAFVAEMTAPGILNLLVFSLTINVSLLVFNMVPAFPMDGGRVLRAVLALWFPHARATAVAALIGRGLAALFILAGLMTGNFSLAMVGLFVFFGAGAEGKEAVLTEQLRGLTVDEAVERRAPVLPAALPVHVAFERLSRSPYSALAVVDELGNLLGIVTRQALKRRWIEGSRGAVALFVEPPALTLECATPLDVARSRMTEAQAMVVAVYCSGSFEGLLDFDSIGRVLALSRVGWFGRHRPQRV